LPAIPDNANDGGVRLVAPIDYSENTRVLLKSFPAVRTKLTRSKLERKSKEAPNDDAAIDQGGVWFACLVLAGAAAGANAQAPEPKGPVVKPLLNLDLAPEMDDRSAQWRSFRRLGGRRLGRHRCGCAQARVVRGEPT
jgi:hypothetical protein